MEPERGFDSDNISWNELNLENWLSSVKTNSNQKELDSSGESIYDSSSDDDIDENSADFESYIEDNILSENETMERDSSFNDGEIYVNHEDDFENSDSPPNVHNIYWGWTSDADDSENDNSNENGEENTDTRSDICDETSI